MAIQITGFKPFSKNTLQGFLSLRLTNIGLEIRDCSLHQKDGKSWVQLPARPYEKDGKTSWAAVVEFYDKQRWEQFQKAALAALDDFRRKGGRQDGDF